MAKDRILRFEEKLLLHRERTPYAEVDLVFGSPRSKSLSLIEVKSWNLEIWRQDLISRRQVARLERARFFLQEKFKCPVSLVLAVVGESEIRYFDDLSG